MMPTDAQDLPAFLGRGGAHPPAVPARGPSPGILSRAQSKLEEFMPARTTPQPPPDVNPFLQAIDGYDQIKRERDEVTAERDELRDKLLSSYHRCESLEARLESEGAFYRQQIDLLRAERDAFARTCVEMASANDAVAEAASQVAKLTLRSREIISTYRARLREARETPAEAAGQVDGMTAPLSEVVGRLPVNTFA